MNQTESWKPPYRAGAIAALTAAILDIGLFIGGVVIYIMWRKRI